MIAAAQKCRRCDGELIHDEKRNCLRCPVCYPENRVQTAPPEKETNYVDVALTEKRVKEMLDERISEYSEAGEERIRQIVQDELMNWHIQKPPATLDEINNVLPVAVETRSGTRALTASEVEEMPTEARKQLDQISGPLKVDVPLTYRQKAKRLGIRTSQRKKVDVLAEIAEREKDV